MDRGGLQGPRKRLTQCPPSPKRSEKESDCPLHGSAPQLVGPILQGDRVLVEYNPFREPG